MHATVERLCLAADLPKPEIVVNTERQPNSWVVWAGRTRYRLHVTEGLLELLEPRELEAVLAHEIAHVANRDATVMTVVGGPGGALIAGGQKLARGWWPMISAGSWRWSSAGSAAWARACSPATASSRPTRAPWR